MGALARTKLSTRMQLLVGLTLVGLLVLCVTALFQLKETMLKLAAGDLASEPPKLRSGDEVAAIGGPGEEVAFSH